MVYPHLYRTEHSETKTTNAEYGNYYALQQKTKIHIQPKLLILLQYIDSNRTTFVENLEKLIPIKSISGSLEHVDELLLISKMTEDWLIKLGMKYERFDIGYHELEGKKVKLPTIILASLGKDPHKQTVCVYGHLDVRRPENNQWLTNPWAVEDIEGHLYGNGVASGKGILLSWFHVVQAFQDSNLELPVNLRFVIESSYHQKSEGLAEFLALRKADFFYNVDNFIVCDREWIGEKHPCVIYGTIGVVHYNVTVEKVPGSSTEPKDDLENIFKELQDEEGKIQVPRFYDLVSQITPEEEALYESIQDFNIEEVRKILPPFKQDWDQVKLLMDYWRLPALFADEIAECTCDKNDKTIAKRRFVVKIVPRQIIDRSSALTINYIVDALKTKLNIGNKVECEVTNSVRYWHEKVDSAVYQAAKRATIQIYKEVPNMTRDDRPSYVIMILDSVLEKGILLLPIANRGSNVGGDNENISKRNYYEGTKLLAAYLYQIADG